jgi:hypothetical protein
MRPDDWSFVSRIHADGLARGVASFETEGRPGKSERIAGRDGIWPAAVLLERRLPWLTQARCLLSTPSQRLSSGKSFVLDLTACADQRQDVWLQPSGHRASQSVDEVAHNLNGFPLTAIGL